MSISAVTPLILFKQMLNVVETFVFVMFVYLRSAKLAYLPVSKPAGNPAKQYLKAISAAGFFCKGHLTTES